ncbi:hypothetical protein ACO0K0_02505 [Undibacterium sp. SXout11W]|uniref:hypothetical protein n=1 Tax=Undibacterium sp. SXout11W TaxID=3413050 RepID=UPI003BF2BEF4
MAKFYLPRKGSSPHIAICHIVHLGGTATYQQIAPHLTPSHQSRVHFDSIVVSPLLDFGFITRDGRYSFKATEKGKDYAGQYLSDALPCHEQYVGKTVPGRTFNPQRELNIAKHRAVAPFRPGSDDYKEIPSLMGNQRVAHKGSSN